MLHRLAEMVNVWETNPNAKWALVVVAVLLAFVVSLLLVRILIDLFWPAMLVTFFGAVWGVAKLVEHGDLNVTGVPSSFLYGGIAFMVPILTLPLTGAYVTNRRVDDCGADIVALRAEIDDLRAKLAALQAAARKDAKA